MLKMTTKIIGARALQNKLRKAKVKIDDTMEDSMQKALRLLQRTIKQYLTGGNPLNVRTARLRGSVQFDLIKRGSNIEGSVGSHVKYAPIHEYGATIHAKSARGMIFQIQGKWVRAHKVVIPKRPHYEPALKSNRERINQIFGRDMGSLLRKNNLA